MIRCYGRFLSNNPMVFKMVRLKVAIVKFTPKSGLDQKFRPN